jgi:hypothetical protein
MSDFVLLDPGTTTPPLADDGAGNLEFWADFIGWANDRRTYLGEWGHSVTIDRFTALGWPEYDLPFCARELSRSARQAVGQLLARIAVAAAAAADSATFHPDYIGDRDSELALSLDVKGTYAGRILALASKEANWSELTDVVEVTPPPPGHLQLICAPGLQVQAEVDAAVASFFAERKLYIVGGLESEAVVVQLQERFGLGLKQIRWTEAEPGSQPRLDSWSGLKPESGLACAVIGTEGVTGLGHSGCEKAEQLAKRRGVIFFKVRTPQEIAGRLCELLCR